MTAAEHLPLLVVADDDAAERASVEAALDRRYGRDYEILGCTTGEADRVLDEIAAAARVVAIILAAGEDGAALLAAARERFPSARRGLLVPWLGWADPTTAEAVLTAMAKGWIDLYVLRPTGERDEIFHRTVSELLQESARMRGEGPAGAAVVADARTARAHELRAALSGLGIPHRLVEPGPDDPVPSVRLGGRGLLVDPSPADLARALGFPTELESHETDALVVGAGPAGLGAAVYAASEGLRTTVIDGGAVGGQAGSSALIRNYLGFPRGLSGGELAQRAYQQAWLFGTRFRLSQRAVGLHRREDGMLVLRSADDVEVCARAVVLALGVEYRRLEAEGVEALEGAGVYYGASVSEAHTLAGEPVIVVGGGNSAGQAALHLARHACTVTMVVRGSGLAASMSQYLIDAIDEASNITVRYETAVAAASGSGRLETVTLRGPEGDEERKAAGLVVLIGALPRTEWLPAEIERDEWGYLRTGPQLTSWSLERPPLSLETSMPGVFAAGDVRAASVKRVAAAAGSGALAVTDVHAYLASREHAGWPVRS